MPELPDFQVFKQYLDATSLRQRIVLGYINVRKLGEVGLEEDPDEFVAAEGLGPDAMEIGRERFEDLISDRRGAVKTTLMNQQVLAGLGNIYTDEILFQARIHPERPVTDLEGVEIQLLHAALQRVLTEAVEARVDRDAMPADFLLRHGREGGDCPRCGASLDKLLVDGRPTYICPQEQPL